MVIELVKERELQHADVGAGTFGDLRSSMFRSVEDTYPTHRNRIITI